MRTATPHPNSIAGESLRKAATSTSRTTGKVTATLITAAACLLQNSPPQHQTPPQRPPSIVGRTPPPIGVDRLPGGNSSDRAVSTAEGGQSVETSIETVANEDVISSARTLLDGDARAGVTETSEAAAATTGAGASTSDSGGKGFALCRQRSSGPLRGGDLM